MYRNQDLHGAVGVQPRRRCFISRNNRRTPAHPFLGAVAGLFGKTRESDAVEPPVRGRTALARAHALVIDQLRHAAHAFGIIAVVEFHLADREIGHLIGAHHVVHAHLHRVTADRARDLVDGAFDGEARAGPGHATIDA